MFAKLLKHEFRATARIVPFIYLVALFMIATNLLTRQLNIGGLSVLLQFLMVVVGLAAILMTYVVIVTRYYKNLYGNEAYLTQTMPVKPARQVMSKAIAAFVWLILSYLVMGGIVLTIMILTAKEQGQSIGKMLSDLIAGLGLEASSFWLAVGALVAYICLSMFYLLAQVYFAITLGNLSRFHSLGIAAPILFYMGTNFVLQLCTLGAMIAVPLGLTIRQGVLTVVPQGMLATLIDPNNVIIGFGGVVFMILATIGLFVATMKLMGKHTSIK